VAVIPIVNVRMGNEQLRAHDHQRPRLAANSGVIVQALVYVVTRSCPFNSYYNVVGMGLKIFPFLSPSRLLSAGGDHGSSSSN
jgi:hypothetical protein